MPENRYFIDESLQVGKEYCLDEEESWHLITVMRGQLHDEVEIINGRGDLAKAHLTHLEKKKARFVVQEVKHLMCDGCELHLFLAIIRPHRLDWVVEKATEMGITHLWLYPADKSEKKGLTRAHLERLKRLLIAAIKQSGRLYLPSISQAPILDEKAFQNWTQMTLFFGDPREGAPLLQRVWQMGKKIGIFIGPEGGFTTREYDLLESFATGAKLNPHVVRSETAALIALSLITHWMFDSIL